MRATSDAYLVHTTCTELAGFYPRGSQRNCSKLHPSVAASFTVSENPLNFHEASAKMLNKTHNKQLIIDKNRQCKNEFFSCFQNKFFQPCLKRFFFSFLPSLLKTISSLHQKSASRNYSILGLKIFALCL